MQDAKQIQKLLEQNEYNELIYSEIFRLLTKTNTTNYSKNSSGVFFDLRNVPNSDLEETRIYIEKINETRKDHASSFNNIVSEYTNLKANVSKERLVKTQPPVKSKSKPKAPVKTKKKAHVPVPVIPELSDEDEEYYSEEDLFGDESEQEETDY